MRNAAVLAALFAASLAGSLPARADPKGPLLLVLPGPEAAKPFVFQLKGAAGELLCTSEGFKNAKAAEAGAHVAAKAGKELKNYLFQKTADAKGHFWELRESKKHKATLCRSGPVAEQAQAEHTAGAATKAFVQATVAVK